MPTVITENDESKWNDTTGVSYHFPKRYLSILLPGTPVIYYKGKLRDRAFAIRRLSPDPHYFGVGSIGEVVEDRNSGGKHFYAAIQGFREFEAPVPIRDPQGRYLEEIPGNRESNYWRDGARAISQSVFDRIIAVARIRSPESTPTWAGSNTNDLNQGLESVVTGTEGARKLVYSSVAERDSKLRTTALEKHGATCSACGFNFWEFYGPYGLGFIHIHHLKPLAGGIQNVDPATDLVPLCANCHSIVHRRRDQLLSVADLKALIGAHGRWNRPTSPATDTPAARSPSTSARCQPSARQ